ncbi:MAG: hypothetical protein KC613_21035 [Myxococcales bacterium]|nr:hypothetical protein [Myxococcales bacterium]
MLSRWGVLMQAGAAPLSMAASEALSLAWAEFGRDVVRLALAELEDWSNQRHGAKPFPAWLGDRCRRIRIRQTADEVGVAVKVAAPSERLRALLDACAAKVRLGSLTPHQQAAVVELVEGESDAVLVTLATRIDATPSVSNPAGLLASMLVEVREEVRRAEAQRAVAERQAAESEARIRAIREHEERMASDPEYRAKRAADAARLREAVEAL